jgi:5-methyltetrahydrofolate--homocysteine methyltransferase
MSIKEILSTNILCMDGGMGTLLQAAGLAAGEQPERWNLSHADTVRSIHRAYLDAGSRIITANTFGANPWHYTEDELREIIPAALQNARAAIADAGVNAYVALDIGPSGKLLRPYGDLDFEDAVEDFAKIVRIGAAAGADLVLIETMNDCAETKAALLAVKENCSLPVFVSNVYGADGKLLTGADPEAMVAMLEGMGADAIGANCSLGPRQLTAVAKRLLSCASVPVLLMPNAGLPRADADGNTVYDVDAEGFATVMAEMVASGVRLPGGCCGTTPEHIAKMTARTRDIVPSPIIKKNDTVVSSYTHAVTFGGAPLLIGERINPTGKKRFKQALIEGDSQYILDQGLAQAEQGAHLLDVNVGIPEIDEPSVLCHTVSALQAVTDLPLQIDTADPEAMERALRTYVGKAMINSVSGKQKSMDAIFPLVKKYGGVVVALTLDERGIPDSAEGRIEIAERILQEAAKYGIDKKDIVFDTLTMTVSTDPKAATHTLRALQYIRTQLGCHTVLGVSNISFGLPEREVLTSHFFTLALENGLSAAIMNPGSAAMQNAYLSFCALRGLDAGCADYVSRVTPIGASASAPTTVSKDALPPLQHAILKGLCDAAAKETDALLATTAPLDVINTHVIPALDLVGAKFEQKTLYLPQLLLAAEAAKAAFERIKAQSNTQSADETQMPFVLATVEGDIHDIGKNIVKLLLENYNFKVIDLGRNVPAEDILAAVQAQNAPLCGLSALMTTTVPAMERTIALLREHAPACRIVVGGAVLTEEYAARIGADHFGSDAMETVRYAERIRKELQ